MRLSVIVPVFNNSDTIGELHRRLVTVLEPRVDWLELVFVDDASTDGSWKVLVGLVDNHPGTVALRLFWNVGQQAAILCGTDHARGEVLAILDADLEHPPEAIPAMLEELRRGHDLVLARRVGRGQSFGRRAASVTARLVARALRVSVPDLGSSFLVVEHRLSSPVRDHYVRTGEHILVPAILAAARSPIWIDVETQAQRISSYSGLKLASVGLNFVWTNRARLLVPGLWTIAAGLAAAALIETPFRQRSLRTAAIVAVMFALWAGRQSGGRRSPDWRGLDHEDRKLYQVEEACIHLTPLVEPSRLGADET